MYRPRLAPILFLPRAEICVSRQLTGDPFSPDRGADADHLRHLSSRIGKIFSLKLFLMNVASINA